MPVRTVDYSAQTFLPLCLDDLVPADHSVRYIRDLVDQLDLDALGFDTDYAPDGRPRVPADLLLCLWLWGYYNGVRSTRKLEVFCSENLGGLWLSGMRTPDHSTLWRFWNKHREAIGNLFKQSVRIAVKAGLVGWQLTGIDGTTIASRSSRRSLFNASQLNKQLEKLDGYLRDLEQQIAESGVGESDLLHLRQSIANAAERKAKIHDALALLTAQHVESVHPHEPDVEVMNCDGRRQPAWNCQAAVDESHGIVVAADVTNEAHDCHCLVRMIDETVANGVSPQLFVADAAYGRSEDEVHRATTAGHRVVTARYKTEKSPYHRSHFYFDRSKMQLICPLGFTLKHTGTVHQNHGQHERFRCLDWERCGAGCECYRKSKSGRIVQISPLHESMQAHRNQFTRVERTLLMRRRLKTVEPLFAAHKEQGRFRRFAFRGQPKVKAQWQMLNFIHNLKLLQKTGYAFRRALSFPDSFVNVLKGISLVRPMMAMFSTLFRPPHRFHVTA